ncbi:hypothetical protein [Chimaeribacter arupi]|uniref:GNAT family N-acetyltransferase n=1 Tax=Chimaeribacter arupi TaxID=2060066 RepID=UPI0011AFAEAB
MQDVVITMQAGKILHPAEIQSINTGILIPRENTMVLSSQRRLLRPISFADTDDLFRTYGDPQTNQFNPAGPYPDIHYARAAIARWLEHW